ncbi:MAG: putative sugar O-methyltransferase [Hoeflea sp.]|uniref:putative sugar O-methyltransferase n=1 Tax=Hoeflea sp. TaxID=1940281 RepID=UPI003297A7F5
MTSYPLLPGIDHSSRFDPAGHISDQVLTAGLAPVPPKQTDAELETLVERICESYIAAKRDQQGLSSEWMPEGEWSNHPIHDAAFRNALQTRSIEEAALTLRDFWRNSLALIVKEYASFEALSDPDSPMRQRFAHNIVRNWLITRELTGTDVEELATAPVGNPWGYEINGTVISPKACRYHLMSRDLRGMVGGLNAPLVGEIGGGYGGLTVDFMTRVPHAAWINYDLPETLAIYSYFVAGALSADRVVMYGETATPTDRGNIAPGTVAAMPNFAIRDLGPRSLDAVVNMFSLSEVGAKPLAAYVERIQTVADGWFVHHNMDRASVINRGHERIPASRFGINPDTLPLIATGFDPFHGLHGDYRWYIHRRGQR